MTMAMQELLYQEDPEYFTDKRIEQMKREEDEHERTRRNRKNR